MTISIAVDSSTNQIDLYGQLDDTCDGLAYYSLNLTLTGPDEVNLGDILTLTRPDAMSSFDNPLGLSNPSDITGWTGYGGTPDGATLLQIGGGQNTLANLDPPVDPTGTVVEGIATGTEPQLLATGTLDTCGLTEGTYTLTITDPYALVLDADQSGPAYTVSPTPVTSDQDFQVSFTILEKSCVATVNSMANHGTTEGDMGIQIYPPQYVNDIPYACESRWGVPYHWLEIELDRTLVNTNSLAVTATDAFGTSVSATVTPNATLDTLTAIFDPPLTNAAIYTVSVTGERITESSFEYAVLEGNCINGEGGYVVSAVDKDALIERLTQTASQAGPQYDIARISTSAGMIDIYDKSLLIGRLGNIAQRVTSAVSVANHGSSAGDLGIQVYPVPSGSTVGNCEPRILSEHRLELTFDGYVDSTTMPLIVEAEDSSNNVTTATVTASGKTATAVFSPALADQKIYTIYCDGCAKGSFPFVVLQGNVYNLSTSENVVNTEDDSDFDTHVGQGLETAGPQYDIDTNGVIDTQDDTALNNRLNNTAS